MRKIASIIALAALASASALAAQQEFTNGVFLLNEDWFGHNSSTVNFFSYADSTIQYRVFQSVNGGKTLGNTTQYMAQDANNIYFCSKQNYDKTGGRFDIVDPKSLKLKKSIATFDGGGDTRACYPFSESKVYVGTTNGIYIYDPTTGTITSSPISGTNSAEPGEMVAVDDKLYVCAMGVGVYVINTMTDQLYATINIEGGASSIFKVGNEVWVSVNSCTWGTPSGSDTEQFVEIDTRNLVAKSPVAVSMACQNSSFAWKKTSPAIDPQNKVLYYAPVDCSNLISKYDMRTGEFTPDFITLPEGQNMYGSVCDIDPFSGNLVVLSFEEWGSQNYYLHLYKRTGEEIGSQIKLTQNYWFPAMVMFARPGEQQPNPPTSVDDVTAAKTVASVKYFNLSGVSSDEPFSGINIKLTTYTDGTTSAVKVMK